MLTWHTCVSSLGKFAELSARSVAMLCATSSESQSQWAAESRTISSESTAAETAKAWADSRRGFSPPRMLMPSQVGSHFQDFTATRPLAVMAPLSIEATAPKSWTPPHVSDTVRVPIVHSTHISPCLPRFSRLLKAAGVRSANSPPAGCGGVPREHWTLPTSKPP